MFIVRVWNAPLMRLLVCSEKDTASVNIRNKMFALSEWRESEQFEGRPTYSRGEMRLIIIGQEHLYRDDLDESAAAFFGEKIEVVTYLSRHRSESGLRSLTVHPIGNHRHADFGGKPRTLVPSAPAHMTGALRALKETAKGLDYTVSFEATHHGPFLKTPTFFIEAGSDETAWSDDKAGEALANAVLKATPARGRVGIGVGGGHYMPRISDVALARDVCIGHMIPSYVLDEFDETILENALSQTPKAEFVYFHRKAIGKPMLRRLEDWFTTRGIKVVREDDLPPL